MALKDQWKRIKENWLIIAAIVVLILITTQSNPITFSKDLTETLRSGAEARYIPSYDSSFAPEVEERQITRTTSITTQVKDFKEAETQLKTIIETTNAILLNENIYNEEYAEGNYEIKVETTKYQNTIKQLKEIGKIKSFSENNEDITGQYTNTQIELETERTRLTRYQQMYNEAKETEDKINLNDRIFDQERRIKYLEEAVQNNEQRVEYATVYLTITKERSGYTDIALIKFSQLIQNLVQSINNILSLIFQALPWLILVGIALLIWKFMKRK